MKKKVIILVFMLVAVMLLAGQLPYQARQEKSIQQLSTTVEPIKSGHSLNSRTIVFECDFTDVTGWTATGGTNWGVAQSKNAGGTAPELVFNWSPSTVALQRYISPEINTTGYTSLNLTFMSMINHYGGDYSLSIETTSDGGTTWNTVWTHEPASMPSTFIPVVIDNDDIGAENFQFAYVFDGDSYNINYWYIDDVILTDEEVPGRGSSESTTSSLYQ